MENEGQEKHANPGFQRVVRVSDPWSTPAGPSDAGIYNGHKLEGMKSVHISEVSSFMQKKLFLGKETMSVCGVLIWERCPHIRSVLIEECPHCSQGCPYRGVSKVSLERSTMNISHAGGCHGLRPVQPQRPRRYCRFRLRSLPRQRPEPLARDHRLAARGHKSLAPHIARKEEREREGFGLEEFGLRGGSPHVFRI